MDKFNTHCSFWIPHHCSMISAFIAAVTTCCKHGISWTYWTTGQMDYCVYRTDFSIWNLRSLGHSKSLLQVCVQNIWKTLLVVTLKQNSFHRWQNEIKVLLGLCLNDILLKEKIRGILSPCCMQRYCKEVPLFSHKRYCTVWGFKFIASSV